MCLVVGMMDGLDLLNIITLLRFSMAVVFGGGRLW